MKIFAYKTNFSDGRPDFWDVIAAIDIDNADKKATSIVRQIDLTGYGCDENAEVELHECATDAASLYDDLSKTVR